MEKVTILNEIVNQLTDNFTKSKSINYLYGMCKKIVENKINELGEYNFKNLSNWLEEIKNNCCKSKYKCIKRIAYSFNYYITNGFINAKARIIYDNDNSQFKKISENSKQIITEYLKNKSEYKESSFLYLRNIIAYYFLFIERNNLNYKNVNCDYIFKFKSYVKSLNLSKTSELKILNTNAKFIYDTSENIKNKVNSIILCSLNEEYAEKIINIPRTDLKLFNLNYDKIDFNKIPLFFKELKDRKYASKTIVHAKRISNHLLFFSFFWDIPLNKNNVLLWSKYVYENILKDKEYRSIGIKFIEFLQCGTFSNSHSYLDSIPSLPHKMHHKIDDIPLWSKEVTDKYIAYRKKLGYKENTICMDCNAIFRFITYLTKLGINSYESIKPEHIFSFAAEDPHSTEEGKNAYITRVKGFLTFLKDNNVIDLHIDSKILGGFRIKKKIINIISDVDIEKITSRKYINPFEIRALAIFLLGIKCGLRSVDIVNLKFKNVSFKEKILKIIQIKTEKEIVLPVSTLVLNSIYNYVKNVRPKSSSEYIFISFKIPFEKLNRSICCKSFNAIAKINGIEENKYKGFHICRKTYASSIINKTKNINITAYSLGHSDNSTVDEYVSINTSHMHECPLSLNEIGFGGFSNGSL